MLLLKYSSTPLLELSGKQKIVQSSGSSKQLIANMTEQQIQENGFEIEVTIPWVPDVFFLTLFGQPTPETTQEKPLAPRVR